MAHAPAVGKAAAYASSEPQTALIITVAIAVGLAGAFLAMFWRPAKLSAAPSKAKAAAA